MKDSNDLFDLIKAMTASEKRYFKLEAAKQKGDKQYLKLFEYLSKQKTNNDRDAIRALGKTMNKNKYNFTRNYLYNTIMASLQSFHSKTMEAQLRDFLQQADILLEKGLKKQAQKMIGKAKKLAADHHDQLGQIEVLLREKNILLGSINEEGNNRLADIAKQIIERTDFFNTETISNDISRQIAFLLNKFGPPRDKKEDLRFHQLINSPVFRRLEHNESALSFNAAYALYRAKTIFYLSKREMDKMEFNAQKVIALKEKNPAMIRKDPIAFVNDINALANAQFHIDKSDDFFRNLEKMRAFPGTLPGSRVSVQLHSEIFFISYLLEFNFYLRNFMMDHGEEVAGRFWAGFERHKKYLAPEHQIYLYYHAALVHLGSNQYEAALQWFNHILNNYPSELVQWADHRIRLLLLVIHFELGHHRLLEHLIVSTYRMMLRKKRLFKYEKTILRFIRKLPDSVNEKALRDLFSELKEELLIAAQDHAERGYCIWFIYWLEGKEKGISLKEVFLEKSKDKRNLLVA